MNAAGAFRKGHAQTFIDDNARSDTPARRATQSLVGKPGVFSGREILFANLYPINASRGGGLNDAQEDVTCASLSRFCKTAPIGDVAENRALQLIGEGHELPPDASRSDRRRERCPGRQCR